MFSKPNDESPKHVILRFYEAEARYMQNTESGAASFEEMRKTLSPAVTLHQSPDLPFGGDYAGHDGYENWAKKMSAMFDRLEVQDQEFFEKDDKVVVTCRLVTRSRVNGSMQDYPMVQVVTVRDGKIIDFRPFYWNVPEYVAAAEVQ